jgi:hypothetical protein
MGKADDLVPQGLQSEITGSVVLEGGSTAVVSVAIGLHHELVFLPAEVDSERRYPKVHGGRRQAMPATHPEELTLQLAAGSVRDGLISGR